MGAVQAIGRIKVHIRIMIYFIYLFIFLVSWKYKGIFVTDLPFHKDARVRGLLSLNNDRRCDLWNVIITFVILLNRITKKLKMEDKYHIVL